MFDINIEGLYELQQEIEEAQQAMQEVDGELGTVSFDPEDPGSIEAAIAEIGRLIDAKLCRYAGNFMIGPMIDGLKQQYRESILEKAAAARLEADQA